MIRWTLMFLLCMALTYFVVTLVEPYVDRFADWFDAKWEERKNDRQKFD